MGNNAQPPPPATKSPREVMRLAEADRAGLAGLLQRFGLQLELVSDATPVPGSFWGDEEAGLRDCQLLARPDTPLHSILHEACHYICMDPERRSSLHTDAGGDYDEENAVCYLQILLADEIDGMNRARMQEDMDNWGYSFRLGSARAWFEQDAQDAREWLHRHGLVDAHNRPTWKVRSD